MSNRHYNYQIIFVATGLTCFSCGSCMLPSKSASQARPQTSRPNIIYINADDLGYSELGCYGNTFNETPNLDLLAAEGVRFSQAYAAAPISSPSRAGFISGCYPARKGITDYIVPKADIHLDTTAVSLPEALRNGGYHTGIIGKWHLSGYVTNGAPREFRPECYHFDEVILSAEQSIGNGSYFYPYHFLPSVIKVDENAAHEFIVDRMNNQALEFIERNNDKNTPFFLYLSHYAVHSMVHGKPELVDRFRAKPECGHSAPSKDNPANDPYKKWPADYKANKNNPHLAAQLWSIDEGVGMIVAKLRELGIDKNTIIIFTSDNGGSLGTTRNTPLRGGKGGLYEGGIREPMIVWQPGTISGGRVSTLPTANYDFYPTLCEMGSVTMPTATQIDGKSIASEIYGKGEVDYNRPLFWLFKIQTRTTGGRPCSAVRMGDWKLIEYLDTNELELYNLKNDLSEKTNLATEEPDRVGEMHEAMRKWRHDVGFE